MAIWVINSAVAFAACYITKKVGYIGHGTGWTGKFGDEVGYSLNHGDSTGLMGEGYFVGGGVGCYGDVEASLLQKLHNYLKLCSKTLISVIPLADIIAIR